MPKKNEQTTAPKMRKKRDRTLPRKSIKRRKLMKQIRWLVAAKVRTNDVLLTWRDSVVVPDNIKRMRRRAVRQQVHFALLVAKYESVPVSK